MDGNGRKVSCVGMGAKRGTGEEVACWIKVKKFVRLKDQKGKEVQLASLTLNPQTQQPRQKISAFTHGSKQHPDYFQTVVFDS